MIRKTLAFSLAATFGFVIAFSSIADARGHRGSRRHCGPHSHIDYGTTLCVKNRHY